MPNDIVKRDDREIQPSRREITQRRETSVRRSGGSGYMGRHTSATPQRDQKAELLAERRRERESNHQYAREEAVLEAQMKAYQKEHGLDPKSQRMANKATMIAIAVIVFAIAICVGMLPPVP